MSVTIGLPIPFHLPETNIIGGTAQDIPPWLGLVTGMSSVKFALDSR